MKKLYSIDVIGKRKNWSFNFWAENNSEFLKEWRDDGLKIDEVVNTIPEWVVDLGLTKLWCWLQDRFIVPLE